MQTRIRRTVLFFLFVLAIAGVTPARAQDRLCDPGDEICRDILVGYINNEVNFLGSGSAGIDVAFWFMEDDTYRAAISRAFLNGVPVRVLIDPDANGTYPLNAGVLDRLRTTCRPNGQCIPMRRRLTDYILHWKMMLFRGQGVVEFSGANYSADAWRPSPGTQPYQNYTDEAIYFTTDPAIVNSFREKFDDFWVDTTSWANYANITTPLTRIEPDGTYVQAGELNFPPEQNYRTRALSRYNATQLSSEGKGIDVIMYRITDQRHTDAMIAAHDRGLPVRLITEQAQYRLVDRMWHSWNVDRLYARGIQIRDRAHAGLNHQKSVILYDQSTTAGDQPLVIFGSSNWTSPSAGGQVEHNMFTSRPYIVNWFTAQFERKWGNLSGTAETKAFTPLPPDAPINPSPANQAVGVATAGPTLSWFGGPWAHLYDVYLDTNPNPTTRIATNLVEGSAKTAVSRMSFTVPANLTQGTTYYWKVVGRTMANEFGARPDLDRSSAVWSFTTAGTPPPPPPNAAGEIVLYASKATRVGTAWQVESDGSAAGHAKMRNPNVNAAKITTASATPSSYFELTFTAEAGRPYHLWMRGKADGNTWPNDSTFIQFDGSVTSGGTPIWRIGTTSAAEYTLEDCNSCGVANWGWQDNGYAGMGQNVYFATTGVQTLRIQVREDGLSIDQIVLSPATYLTTAPGPLKNDTTILAESNGSEEPPPPPPPPPPPATDNVVLYATDATFAGAWQLQVDQTAADSRRLYHPNAGAAKLATALAQPVNYFEMTFNAEAGRPYRIWMRASAEMNNWGNDSAFIQFDGSVDSEGTPIWRIGTTAAAEYNLEDCSGCGLSGWGWQDNGWGVNVMGPPVYFATTGPQTIRVQTREDGLFVDQVVLSPSTYLNTSPGTLKNDTTIVPK